MHDRSKAYLWLHLSVIFWGFTAILGKLISIHPFALVWWRVCLTSLILCFIPNLFRTVSKLSLEKVRPYIWIGVLLSLHWICFYTSIHIGNASIALVTLATTSFFTALFEPFILRQRHRAIDLILGLVVIPALWLAVTDFDVHMIAAFWVGILSAVLLAYLSIKNRQLIHNTTPLSITLIEMMSALIFLSISTPFINFAIADMIWMPDTKDLILLLLLSSLFTIVPYVLHLHALKYISAFSVNLIVNLEPVYGILLAILILKEHHEMDSRFYIGVLVISIIALVYPFFDRSKDIDKAH